MGSSKLSQTIPSPLARERPELAPRRAPAADSPKQVTASAATEVGAPANLANPFDAIELGSVIDSNYRVLGELGRGGMGLVLRAHDTRLDRDVALKLIRAELLTERFRARFIDEARAMARVNHPNVLGIHTFGEHASVPYFVMELVEGPTLEQWLAASHHVPELCVAFDLMHEICLGVSAVHAAGALHRDIKPSNILLDSALHPRVADLGVAVLYHEHSSVGPEVVGTPAYMAPEVAFPVEGTALSPRADVYSLACVAYELFTGQLLYQGRGGVELMVYHATEPVPIASTVRPGLPAVLDEVLLAALDRDPHRRTASVAEFSRGLQRAREAAADPDRILVAEDDPDFRQLLQETLHRSFPNADIACATNGQEALQVFEERAPAVAILDLRMPILDGVGLTKILRSKPASAGMPIIVLTGAGGAEEWKRLSSIGADRFLVKPVSLDDVVTLIRRAIRERTGPFLGTANGERTAASRGDARN